jgi:hypothetical protein
MCVPGIRSEDDEAISILKAIESGSQMKYNTKVICVVVVTAVFISAIGLYFFKTSSRRQFSSQLFIQSDSRSFFIEEPVMTGFQLTEYTGGKKSMSIHADKLYVRNRKISPLGFRISLVKSAELEEVDATFFKDNKPVACLHSKAAELDKKSNNILFKGGPFLLTESHRSLEAQEIFWNNSERKLLAKGNCSLGTDKGVHQGASITTDMELQNFKVVNE